MSDVWVARDCDGSKEAETIQSTGKMAKMIRIAATTSRMKMLKRFWNFCEVRRVSRE
jgi:hypothetical protein